jgi:hypothetical protein
MKTLNAYIFLISILCANDNILKYRLTLHAFDQEGNSHSIIFGIDPAASYGYDGHLDEKPIPPSPPLGIFDFRFKDLPGRGRIPSEGSYIDIRKATGKAQCDTFIVYAQASNNKYPMTVTLEGDRKLYTDSIVVEAFPKSMTERIDLRKGKTFSILSDSESAFRIIVYTRSPDKK